MDENTIFQGTQPVRQSISSTSQPTAPNFPPQETIPPQPKSRPFKMLKLFLGIIVIIIVGLIIFGLISSRFSKKPEMVTISYWGLFQEEALMAPIISGFQKDNPNIKVEYVKQDIKQYVDRLANRVPAGTGPDVFLFHNTWVPMLSTILLPIPTEAISKSDFEKSFYAVSKKDLVRNGAIYGMPIEMDTLSLYVNKKMFDAAGLSVPTKWEDFINYSRQLTVKDQESKIKTAGAAMGTYDNVLHAPDIVSMLFAQNGVNLEDIGSKPERASEALAFYTSFAKGPGNVWDNTLDSSLLAFAKENLAMFFGYARDLSEIKNLNPILEFEIHPVPHLPGQDITVASYWVGGVSLKSKNQKEALLFLKYITKHNTLERIFIEESKIKGVGHPYPNVNFSNSLKDHKFAYPFVSQGNGAVSSFFVDQTFDNRINSSVNNYLRDAISSIVNNNASSESVVDPLSEGVTQVLQQYSVK